MQKLLPLFAIFLVLVLTLFAACGKRADNGTNGADTIPDTTVATQSDTISAPLPDTISDTLPDTAVSTQSNTLTISPPHPDTTPPTQDTTVTTTTNTKPLYNIPKLYLTTETGKEVTSTSKYIGGTVAVEPRNNTYTALQTTNIKVRGRGNSTWKYPKKKSYRVEFEGKVSLFGLPAADSWVLLANYFDPALSRNNVAYEMARQLRFDFVPSAIPVDLYLNGAYRGVYYVGDFVEAKSGRVSLDKSADPDTGYLLELLGSEDSDTVGVDYFDSDCYTGVLLKQPDTKRTPDQFKYIRDYFLSAEQAIKSGGNWEQYIDIDSFVDYFLLTELTYNLDGTQRSIFISKDKGGKLKIASVWDFDIAFGNYICDYGYKNWATVHSNDKDTRYRTPTWYNYLIKDPTFKAAVKARWNSIGGKLYNTALAEIDRQSALLATSAEDNIEKWVIGKINATGTIISKKTLKIPDLNGQNNYIKDFLKTRKAWIDTEIGKL
jgi:hypothetical protein